MVIHFRSSVNHCSWGLSLEISFQKKTLLSRNTFAISKILHSLLESKKDMLSPNYYDIYVSLQILGRPFVNSFSQLIKETLIKLSLRARHCVETRNESHSILLKWIKVYRWESILAILLISEQGSHKNISEGCSAWAGLSGTGERDVWLLHLESELSRNDSDLEKSHKQQGQWTVTALIRCCCTGRGSLTRVTEAMRKH